MPRTYLWVLASICLWIKCSPSYAPQPNCRYHTCGEWKNRIWTKNKLTSDQNLNKKILILSWRLFVLNNPNFVFILSFKEKHPRWSTWWMGVSHCIYIAYTLANATLYLCALSVVVYYDLKAPHCFIIQINGDAYHQDLTAREYYINGNQARFLNIEYWIGHDITQ